MTGADIGGQVDQPSGVVFVTGPSGAGRTTALRCLEDLGYEAIDNLPLSLLPALLNQKRSQPLCLGLDVRNRDYHDIPLTEAVGRIRAGSEMPIQILFLDCRAEILVKRFSETRRRHPLSPSESAALGVDREQKLMAAIRPVADVLIDTSDMTPHDLRAELDRWFAAPDSAKLAVSVHSFSYKRGLPPGMDMVFDCRFLQNPYWSANLREKDGRDAEVSDYIAEDPRYAEFFERVLALAEFLLPAYLEEGKSHLALAFGCTGGQHRSVALAEKLAVKLAGPLWAVSTRHHELERRGRMHTSVKAGDAA